LPVGVEGSWSLDQDLNPGPPSQILAQWLRHCAANQKVAGSIPDDVIGISH
jgi:hypothetical protein